MEIYHILLRGVDKRKIFLQDTDYLRFIHDLFEFNDEENVNSTFYVFRKNKNLQNFNTNQRHPRKLLVNIHLFCLMPNHYHLLASPLSENAIPKFMHKLNKGYSRYFNIKHERKGTLFEGPYKSILVQNDSHFIHLPYYIHLNPLDLIMPEWRKGELKNYKESIRFLENYRWSSHLDYLGIKNFPSITQRKFLLNFFNSSKEYKKSIYEWLKKFDLNLIEDLSLE